MNNREYALQQQSQAEKLDVFAARLITGDGTKFFCAKNHYEAVKKAKADSDIARDAQVRKADLRELKIIAVRALEGLS